MAQTTVELRNLLKTNFELFDFDYQFDDEKMKKDIEESIIDHYYFHEIGQETPDRFKHVFKTRFKKLIGYYNQLHNTTLLSYDPLINYKMTEALERLANTKGEHSESSERKDTGSHSDNVERTVLSNNSQTTNVDGNTETLETTNSSTDTDTSSDRTLNTEEQSSQIGADYPQNDSIGNYPSEAQETESTGQNTENTSSTQNTDSSGTTNVTGTSQSTEQTSGTQSDKTTESNTGTTTGDQTENRSGVNSGEQTESYEKTIEGLTGRTYQELIQLERENILRIKSMIINELKPCFMMTH